MTPRLPNRHDVSGKVDRVDAAYFQERIRAFAAAASPRLGARGADRRTDSVRRCEDEDAAVADGSGDLDRARGGGFSRSASA
jgi:hypothetical protein